MPRGDILREVDGSLVVVGTNDDITDGKFVGIPVGDDVGLSMVFWMDGVSGIGTIPMLFFQQIHHLWIVLRLKHQGQLCEHLGKMWDYRMDKWVIQR